MFKKILFIFLLSTSFASKYSYTILNTNEKVNIDGILDEEVWKTGNPISNFSQKDPNPGEPARQKTEVRVAIDDEFIYVGAYLYDNSGEYIGGVSVRAPRSYSYQTDSNSADLTTDKAMKELRIVLRAYWPGCATYLSSGYVDITFEE